MNNILPMMNNNNYGMNTPSFKGLPKKPSTFASLATRATLEIGRASCRERV